MVRKSSAREVTMLLISACIFLLFNFDSNHKNYPSPCYHIALGSSINDLDEKVERLMREGYKCLGGVEVFIQNDNIYFIQAMNSNMVTCY